MRLIGRATLLAVTTVIAVCCTNPTSAQSVSDGSEFGSASERATHQPPPDDPANPVDALCAEVRSVKLPSSKPARAVQTRARGRSAEDYYYGIGVAVDYGRAYELAVTEASEGAPEVLMMLAANGRGVARNLDLAIKLACELECAPAEHEYRVRHLHRLRTRSDDRPFDICDDVTSTMMEGWCTARDGKLLAQQQEHALAVMTSHWSPAQRAALGRLRSSGRAFWSARTANEIDTEVFMGTAMTYEEEELRNGLFAALQSLEQGNLPQYTADQALRADEELNQVYGALLRANFQASALTPRGLRIAERAWLAYRRAWVEFGAARFPEVEAKAWETWATLARTEQLSSLLEAL